MPQPERRDSMHHLDPKTEQRRAVYRHVRAGLVAHAQAYEEASGEPTGWVQVPTMPAKLMAALDEQMNRRPAGVTHADLVVLVSQSDDDPAPRLLLVRETTADIAVTMLAAELNKD